MTYDLLASSVLTSSASSVTFSSINQGYRDLVLVFEGTASEDSTTARIRYNADSGASNYLSVRMQGDGTTASSGTNTDSLFYSGVFYTTSRQMVIHQVMDYSATDKHKSVLERNNHASTLVQARAERWASTAAVSSIEVFLTSGNFSVGNTVYLYGIAS